FTPPGGSVRVGLANRREGALLSIADDGPGIPESERELVLQRFYRSQNAKDVSGSGLGLSIVVAVLDLHGFTLRIARNERGTGTLMRVECWRTAREP
ncbi:MAG TPA: sensor histidine kinase, partial [Burkholderiales bacterium]